VADIYAGLDQYPNAVVVTDSWAESRRVELSDKEREELLALAALTNVILTTGRRWATSVRHDALAFVTVVPKPYDLDELVRTVRAAVSDRMSPTFELKSYTRERVIQDWRQLFGWKFSTRHALLTGQAQVGRGYE
jgi:hypothetical protein